MNNRIQKLEFFLSQNPNDLFSNYAFALELIKTNSFLLACDYLKRCIQLDQNYLSAYYQLALVYIQLKNQDSFDLIKKEGILLSKSLKDSKTENEFNILSF